MYLIPLEMEHITYEHPCIGNHGYNCYIGCTCFVVIVPVKLLLFDVVVS